MLRPVILSVATDLCTKNEEGGGDPSGRLRLTQDDTGRLRLTQDDTVAFGSLRMVRHDALIAAENKFSNGGGEIGWPVTPC